MTLVQSFCSRFWTSFKNHGLSVLTYWANFHQFGYFLKTGKFLKLLVDLSFLGGFQATIQYFLKTSLKPILTSITKLSALMYANPVNFVSFNTG